MDNSADETPSSFWQINAKANSPPPGGLLVLAAGIFMIRREIFGVPTVSGNLAALLLLSGLFVLVFSDTELCPSIRRVVFRTTHHAEVLQHKAFAVLLLALGVIELLRARRTLKRVGGDTSFPQSRWSDRCFFFSRSPRLRTARITWRLCAEFNPNTWLCRDRVWNRFAKGWRERHPHGGFLQASIPHTIAGSRRTFIAYVNNQSQRTERATRTTKEFRSYQVRLLLAVRSSQSFGCRN